MHWFVRAFVPQDKWRSEFKILLFVVLVVVLGHQTILTLLGLWCLCRLTWRVRKHLLHHRGKIRQDQSAEIFLAEQSPEMSDPLVGLQDLPERPPPNLDVDLDSI